MEIELSQRWDERVSLIFYMVEHIIIIKNIYLEWV